MNHKQSSDGNEMTIIFCLWISTKREWEMWTKWKNRKKENYFYCDVALVFICVSRRRRNHSHRLMRMWQVRERERHNIRTWIHEFMWSCVTNTMQWRIPPNDLKNSRKSFRFGIAALMRWSRMALWVSARERMPWTISWTTGRQINHEYNDMVAIVKIKRNKYTDNVFINKLLLG